MKIHANGRRWLFNEGEVGRVLAGNDWSTHALGDPENWPAPLIVALQIGLASRQPIFIWWGEQCHQFYNDACLSMLREHHPAWLGVSAPRASPELWNALGPSVRAAFGAHPTAATACPLPNYPVRFACSPLPGEGGRVGGVLAICSEPATGQDEAAQRQAHSELRQSEERYALAARATREAIWDCDLGIGQVHWNRAIADLFGWEEAVRGSSLEWWRVRVHPDDRARVTESIQAATATAQRSRWHAEYRFLRADGQYADVMDRGFIMRDAHGAALRMVGAMLDVTRTKRVEMALRESEARKDEFLATLAHELRNPLAPLRNASYLLGLQEPGADAKPIHAIIDRQVCQLVRLVDDLLDVSRVTRGKIALQRSLVELTSVIDTAVEASRPLLDAARHGFTVTLPEGPVCLDADPTRLAQVFTNLLNNAAKFTDAGGRVWLTAECSGDEVLVTVGDTGIGIPPGLLAAVFDIFRQIEGPSGQARGGLGIGLTLVKRLVQMHGGKVEAHSDGIGRGSRFVVTLPMARESRAPRRPGAPGTSAETVTSAQTGAAAMPRRVLVVDDNVDSANSLALLLRRLGHDVRVAYDGESGLSAALAHRPHLVFLDLGLPDLSGHEVAQRLRVRFGPGQMRLVAMTGYGQAKDRLRSIAAGFDQHLVKPVEWPAIEATLEA